MYKIVLTIFYYVGNHPEQLKIRAFVVSRRLRRFRSWAWPGGWVEFRVAGPRAPEGYPCVLERVRGGPSARGDTIARCTDPRPDARARPSPHYVSPPGRRERAPWRPLRSDPHGARVGLVASLHLRASDSTVFDSRTIKIVKMSMVVA